MNVVKTDSLALMERFTDLLGPQDRKSALIGGLLEEDRLRERLTKEELLSARYCPAAGYWL